MGLCKGREETKEKEATSPMDLWYMNKLRYGMTIIDSWPYEALGQEEPRKIPVLQEHKALLGMWSVTFYLQLNFILLHHATMSIFELGNNIITTMINFIDNYRVTMIMTKSYREATRLFVNEIHLFHYRHKSEYTMKIYNKMNRVSNILCKYQLVLVTNAWCFFNVMPLIVNWKAGMFSSQQPENVTFINAINYAVPFDIFTWIPGFAMAAMLSATLSFWVAICFSMFDFYLAAIVCQVWGHLDVIQHDLKTMPLPKNAIWYTPEESEEISAILKRNMHHHATITKYVQQCSIAFGPMLAVSFAFYQIGCCLLLLMCSTADSMALAKYGLAVVVYFQLINFSVIFEFLGTKSERMINSVYNVPWELMGVRERRLVLFFLMNVQTPIRIKALGLVPVGVNTMASIMKTSISYFVMLKTFTVE